MEMVENVKFNRYGLNPKESMLNGAMCHPIVSTVIVKSMLLPTAMNVLKFAAEPAAPMVM
jgi:hypothetical protein